MQSISLTTLQYPGIYCIYNKVNNKRYIGSSNNLSQRLWKHRAVLRHNHHENQHLQNAWNKYGEANFEYIILEKCDLDALLAREEYYIKLYKPEYNFILTPTRPTMSATSRRKMSESRIMGIKNGTIKKTHNRHIFQYDLQGNFIAEYDSIRSAAAANHIHQSMIFRCFGKTHYRKGGGYQWSYTKKEKLGVYHKHRTMSNKYVYTVISDTERLDFDGCAACAKYFNVTPSVITDVVRSKRLYRKRFHIIKNCRASK